VRGMFFGKRGGGVLDAEDIKSIAAVFPRAAGAVDDLYFSACNTAAEIADWTPIFPNLRTAWAYLGTAPASPRAPPRTSGCGSVRPAGTSSGSTGWWPRTRAAATTSRSGRDSRDSRPASWNRWRTSGIG